MSTSQVHSILSTDALMACVAAFNRNDQELYRQHIPNDRAAAWLGENIPLFECPDKEIEEIYYFRWWTFRKHLKETPDGDMSLTEAGAAWPGRVISMNFPSKLHHASEADIKNATRQYLAEAGHTEGLLISLTEDFPKECERKIFTAIATVAQEAELCRLPS